MTPAIIGVEHDGGGVALTMDGRDARSLRDREDGREKREEEKPSSFLKRIRTSTKARPMLVL